MGILTQADLEILPYAIRHNRKFHVATEWYLRGFIPLPYQEDYHYTPLKNTTMLTGVAAGKTSGSAASCVMDCLSTPWFKALNTSVTAKQSELPFEMFMGWYEGNPHLEHLVEDIKLRPWPIIKFKNYSSYEFRTAGTTARFIRGTEYDRIVFDECGLDLTGEIAKVLRGRLRGRRPDGTLRMSRLDTITSPTDVLWLRERFDRGWSDSDQYMPNKYKSFKIRTRENVRLTEEQFELMEAEYSDEEIDVEMNAEWPDFGLSFFPKSSLNRCSSFDLLAVGQDAVRDGIPGWVIEEHPRHGIYKWEMPYDPEGWYVMAGDPGKDDIPRRNSGCVAVLNIAKQPAQLAYLHWVSGRGSINPFLDSFNYAINKYRPIVKMVDNTGPQSGTQEVAFTNVGIETEGINFNTKKDMALNHLSYNVTNHELEWPLIKGLHRQMSSYNREMDKKSDFPQDITMTMAMLALGYRYKDMELEEVAPKANMYSRRIRTNRQYGRKKALTIR